MKATRACLFICLLAPLLPCCGGGSSSKDGGDGGCQEQQIFPVDSQAFTGSDPCAGVMENLVFRSSTEWDTHIEDHCATVQTCSGGACGGAMGSIADSMIVYAAGTASGCDASASIVEVRACDDEIQVDYTVAGVGLCDTVINAWAAAWVPTSDLPVAFKLLE